MTNFKLAGEDHLGGADDERRRRAIFDAEGAEGSRRAEEAVTRGGGGDGREERAHQSAFITLRGVMNAPGRADFVGANRDQVAFSCSASAKSGCAKLEKL